MSRYAYLSFAIIAVIAGAAFLSYKTTPVQVASFGGVSLRLDYATTTAAQERGLGGRASVPDDYGILFVFQEPDLYGFWMKDMLVPIDIFWLKDARDGSKGHLEVVSMATNVLPSTYPNVFYPPEPVQYVLETMAGFARAHNITTGTPLYLKNMPIVSE